ncbi:unnamed protein product [Clonostachys solani]|uniref:Uncharacterized protein n=1 Tax=Clonostachys solani TaxID=160281 RepID=A0A9N9ZNF6_9HYPO|nr:unnamed protein product [Clonostachys solani]
MVATNQLSLTALLWLSLANQGLALGIDEATNDLTLMERSPVPKPPIAKAVTVGLPTSGPIHRLRDEEEELDTRDEELEERDYEELDERDFEELDERDLDIETRQLHGSGRPGHGPRKHGRDLQESDIETRSPRRAIPGGNRASWGGQNGPKRPRDIEARQFQGRRGGFGGGAPHGRHRGPRDVEELDERDNEELYLEARSPGRAIPGGNRASWGGQRGPKQPRDIETRQFLGSGRPGHGPSHGPRKHGRSLDVRKGGFGKTRGPRRPRNLEHE